MYTVDSADWELRANRTRPRWSLTNAHFLDKAQDSLLALRKTWGLFSALFWGHFKQCSRQGKAQKQNTWHLID